MKKILFMGDSITDAGRTAVQNDNLGTGYPLLVSSAMAFGNPGEYEFVNRGISGNRIVDLIARVKADMINLKPDYMSILIGVNDVWHKLDYSNGVDTPRFEMYYNLLIEQLKEALPDLKIMIFEPFVLKGTGTEKYFDEFKAEVTEKAAAAKRVAEKNNLVFIPLQDKFNEALKKAPESYWLRDGVHPTPAGHELIKNEWLKNFEKIK